MTTSDFSRRHWLLTAVSAAMALPGCVSQPQLGGDGKSKPPTLNGAMAARVDRVTWGATDSELQRAEEMGFEAFLAEQLRGNAGELAPDLQERFEAMSISREPVDSLVLRLEEKRKAADSMAQDEQKKAAQQEYQQELNRLAREAMSRHLLRALYSPNQVLEQMTWFWTNHFSVHQYKHNLRAMLGDYDKTLRSHALGHFRALLGAVVRHPAMLRYLDNEQNSVGHVNENYARELMELHTLGVSGGYTQADVQELARVLTGVGVNLSGAPTKTRPELQGYVVRAGLFEFNPNRHDFGSKHLLGRPLTAKGLAEVDEALDQLVVHPSTARFICHKLAVFWMSDTPPKSVTAAMTNTFRQSDGDIAQVLHTLFAQPEFWRARKFKDPMRYVISAARAAYDRKPILNTGPILGWLARMGEQPFGRQTPDGYPLESSAWSSAGQMTTRFEIAKAIGSASAGLFRPEEPDSRDQPAFPQLATPLHYSWRASILSTATRAALAQATSPQEWNTFLLSSPEFMQR